MMTTAVLIVAGGSGTRLGAEIPKQYLVIKGQSILRHTIEAFWRADPSFFIQVVIRARDKALYDKAVAGLALPPPVIGGTTRQQSVYNGLKALPNPKEVLIHDAARPFVNTAVIKRVQNALKDYKGVIPALPLTDTIKQTNGENEIVATVSRDSLWGAQTPQGFCYQTILKAHEALQGESLTDDSSLLEHLGIPVKIVQGDPLNKKITTKEDYKMIDIRVGHGIDVHATEPGEGVWLLGVLVPADFRLQGHSDADVGLHAICDALFGAISDGDIGQHFPPTDPQWKNADSTKFLQYAGKKVREVGGVITHIDVTILGERPKVSPHRDAMRKVVADVLEIDVARVSVKATTTEKLGFIGRGEGLMATATATVVF